MTQFAKETLPTSLADEMRRSYLDYAMSVIQVAAAHFVRKAGGLAGCTRRIETRAPARAFCHARAEQ